MWLAGCGIVLLGWAAWTYNRLVRQQQMVAEAWSGVDVQLKRRHDLVPRLVATVAAYRDYERAVLESVVSLRSSAVNASSVHDRSTTETELSKELRHLLVLVENYPDLKAGEQFLSLQKELVSVENEIQMARRYFNGTVRDFNILVESFPSSLIAKAATWRSCEYFELESATERVVPRFELSSPAP